ncbi:MAG: hypothetical protein MUE41_12045 [Gemmatimonadaceae bacterium]|jgi:hypothetical protein|nr:hypothetical protein [Gemmatimonadaceae bacterium]
MLLKKVLTKNIAEPLNFPVKFSRLSSKSTANNLVFQIGHTKGDTDALPAKFRREHCVTKVDVIKHIDESGHWHLMFHVEKPAADTSSAPKVKLVKIDLTQEAYRVIYNATADPLPASSTYLLGELTLQDVYRHLFVLAKEKGRWQEKGYNCQDFVNELLARLGVLET